MHECIAHLCIDFYYDLAGGTKVLARLFAEGFKRKVPERAIDLAATCVSKIFIAGFLV
jgi:hypothetical protein